MHVKFFHILLTNLKKCFEKIHFTQDFKKVNMKQHLFLIPLFEAFVLSKLSIFLFIKYPNPILVLHILLKLIVQQGGIKKYYKRWYKNGSRHSDAK